MRAKDIQIGHTYAAKVSGSVVPVRITGPGLNGRGWRGVNTLTGRDVRIVGPQRLRYPWDEAERAHWEAREEYRKNYAAR